MARLILHVRFLIFLRQELCIDKLNESRRPSVLLNSEDPLLNCLCLIGLDPAKEKIEKIASLVTLDQLELSGDVYGCKRLQEVMHDTPERCINVLGISPWAKYVPDSSVLDRVFVLK